MHDRRRQSMLTRAEFRPEGESDFVRGLVRDVSEGGLKIKADAELPAGSRLEVRLPRIGLVNATVVWCRGGFVGVELEKPIDPDLLKQEVTGSYHAPPAPPAPVKKRLL